MLLRFLHFSLVGFCVFLLSCGNSGKDEDSDTDSCCGELEDIRGSLISAEGTGSEFQSWQLLLVNRETGLTHASSVEQGGLFYFQKVEMEATYTLVLVSDLFKLQSVLSIPSETEGTIHQFIRLKKKYIGNIVYNGATLNLQILEDFEIDPMLANDADGDGIPNGATELGAKTELTGVDAGLALDPGSADIDRDGIINLFDADDDGDGIIDLVDEDANGDDINDDGQNTRDIYFPGDLEYAMVQYESVPQADGSKKSYLAFKAQLRDEHESFAAQLLGPASLLDGANIEALDNTGVLIDVAWNRRLEDDGFSNDVFADDLLFGEKIRLPVPSLAPLKNDVFIFQLFYGPEDAPYMYSWPVTMPSMTLGTITASFNTATRVVTKSGSPFPKDIPYKWTVSLFNSEDQLVWGSSPLDSDETTFTIPEGQLKSGNSYKISVSARLPDLVTGFHSYTVYSPRVSITAQ